MQDRNVPIVSRSIVLTALFSERFDQVSGATASADDSALRAAQSVLAILLPYANDAAAAHLSDLSDFYR
jgi:hypothetical protein